MTSEPMMTAPAIGIDLGTTYSCVAVYRNGRPEVIANALGNRVTPSVVSFGKERLVGDAAKEKETQNPENTIFDVKRLIGRRYDDPAVQRDVKTWPFEVIEEDERPKVRVTHLGEKRTFAPEEISAMVLSAMKTTADTYLGKPARNAVVTVPAHFTDSQRRATKDAATIAGLHVLRIINEPTAAALAYGLSDAGEDERQVLIFDLGGGTFDVSILSIEEGIFEVRATAGDTHLGGTDFDKLLAKHFAAEFERRHDCDLSDDKYAHSRLRAASEKAKRTLSVAHEATVQIENLHNNLDFTATITRARFEEICGALFRATLDPVRKALQDAEMEASEIDEVVLVGGSSRIPAVQGLLREIFPDKELTQTVNPDEAVAIGAAVQAAVLDGDRSETVMDLVLVDVTPLSLGIGVRGDIMAKLIDRNTTIPCRRVETFSTAVDNQQQVEVRVFEGERTMTRDNNLLGRFVLSGIALAPRGVTKIDVTFEINENGILEVSAVEQSTGKTNKITITNDKGRLSKHDIDRMVREAKQLERQDVEQKAAARVRCDLEDYCFKVKAKAEDKQMKDKISAADKQHVVTKCNEAIQWMDSNPDATKDDYSKTLKDLHEVCDPIMIKVF
ncbi:hsp70 protein domain-containing protein [Phthorimaea operculella]|nr:hsp70 protein domain-containing protein [Phthorimaea operculella]